MKNLTKKISLNATILAMTLSLSVANAATGVIKESAPDNTGGQLSGGAIGFLLGGLAGPVGSFAGGAVGALLGDNIQKAGDLSGTRYMVIGENGNAQWYRSTGHTFAIGDKVQTNGTSLAPLSSLSK